MRVNYTPEEIAEMHDRNENFNGTRANFSKIKLYQAVKSDLVEFMNMCDDVRMIDGYDPNMKEKHAILWLDFSPAATLNKEETAALTAIMRSNLLAWIATLPRYSFGRRSWTLPTRENLML